MVDNRARFYAKFCNQCTYTQMVEAWYTFKRNPTLDNLECFLTKDSTHSRVMFFFLGRYSLGQDWLHLESSDLKVAYSEWKRIDHSNKDRAKLKREALDLLLLVIRSYANGNLQPKA